MLIERNVDKQIHEYFTKTFHERSFTEMISWVFLTNRLYASQFSFEIIDHNSAQTKCMKWIWHWNEMKWNSNQDQNPNPKLIIKYQIETSLAEAYCIHLKDLTALCKTRDTDVYNLTWREHVKGSRHQRLDRSTWVDHVRAPQSFWINRKRGAHLPES